MTTSDRLRMCGSWFFVNGITWRAIWSTTPELRSARLMISTAATVTTAGRTLMSDLNELRSRGVEEQANARILALELYLKNKNQGHGVGFVAFELVLDRRMLKQVAVVVYGLTAAALTM